MADDAAHLMAHVQDAYYFEVPRILASAIGPSYETLEDIPQFMRDSHPHATLEEHKAELAGKILIPQPFGGKLHDLHSKESGFCLSKFMVLEVVVALLLCGIFIPLGRRIRNGERPRGRLWNFFEVMVVFMRDEVARPAIGKHDADRFLPFIWTIFFFVLFCNLTGMFPWLGTPTGALATTGTLALITFAAVIGSGMVKLGGLGFWKAQVPHMELPFVLALILIPMIFAIEVLGLFIKHTILAVRLLANMFAGHMVLVVIIGFIVQAAAAGAMLFWGVMPVTVLGAAALSCLELFVAFLQAYIFAFLAALFIGMAVHPH